MKGYSKEDVVLYTGYRKGCPGEAEAKDKGRI
ncbi:hypothetical protein JOD24_000993 [Kroppenstedtia sanguinis]|mgnify:CR=1 FL=1